MDLALLHGEIDAVVGNHTREPFGDPGQFDRDAHRGPPQRLPLDETERD